MAPFVAPKAPERQSIRDFPIDRLPDPDFNSDNVRKTAEWLMLGVNRPNTLLIGSDAAVDHLFGALARSLRAPIVQWSPLVERVVPSGLIATLIVRDVSTLSADQQRHLREWVDTQHDVQIVSVTSEALFPLVECGKFDEALYYRLNLLCFDLPAV
jgi:hypothetical protein